MKYKDWVADWLKYYVSTVTKKRTLEKYSSLMYRHVIPRMGDFDIEKISGGDIQKLIYELLKNLSTSTVNCIISVIKNSFKCALVNGLIKNDCSNSIRRPRVIGKKVECFSVTEQKKIERYIIVSNCEKMFGVIVCLYTGLRIGELLALKWSDIDFENNIVNITKTCHDSWVNGKYKKVIETPKTETSKRLIPISPQLATQLKFFKKNGSGEYIIPGKTAQGAEIRLYQKSFSALLKKLGIQHRGFHSLRHTFATRAIEFGMDVKTLSEILGHADVGITLQRYTHSLFDHKSEMMKQFGKYMLSLT